MKHIFKILAVFGLVAMLTSAQAANRHVYNGSYCNAYWPAESGDFLRDHAGIRNLVGYERYISCPVLVDESGITTGTQSNWIHFDGNGHVECTLSSNTAKGVQLQTKTGSRYHTGWLRIAPITYEVQHGNYSMVCKIPAYGTINSISLTEKD